MNREPETKLETEYDFSLAITAKKVLKIEVNPLRVCYQTVYTPRKKVLENLADKPKDMRFFWDCPYLRKVPERHLSERKEGKCLDVYFITPDKKVVYFGTIMTEALAVAVWKWYLEKFKNREDTVRDFMIVGPMAICSERGGLYIPIPGNFLSLSSTEKGIRRYLKNFYPSLRDIAIEWLPGNNRLAFLNTIQKRAGELFRKQTKKEKEEIIKNDFFD